jgi:hypothetical protein
MQGAKAPDELEGDADNGKKLAAPRPGTFEEDALGRPKIRR